MQKMLLTRAELKAFLCFHRKAHGPTIVFGSLVDCNEEIGRRRRMGAAKGIRHGLA